MSFIRSFYFEYVASSDAVRMRRAATEMSYFYVEMEVQGVLQGLRDGGFQEPED